uniref:IS3 family transposase n=1 Tax=Escherichia coli TaxID=562 RepID=UPI002077812C
QPSGKNIIRWLLKKRTNGSVRYCQYTSYCYDNACVESFFHSLKVECIHGERFSSREIMRATVFNYIECDYNRWRRHSACGGLSPEQFENHNLA